MKFMYCSIIYRYSDILLKKHNFIYNRLFCCNHTCYCVGMVSVTSASSYVTAASRNQNRSLMYIPGLIPRNSMELAWVVPIGYLMQGSLMLPSYQVYNQRLQKSLNTKWKFSCMCQQMYTAIILNLDGLIRISS